MAQEKVQAYFRIFQSLWIFYFELLKAIIDLNVKIKATKLEENYTSSALLFTSKTTFSVKKMEIQY